MGQDIFFSFFFSMCRTIVTSALSDRTFLSMHMNRVSSQRDPIICTPAFTSNSVIQQGTGSSDLFKSNAPLTMHASGVDIFCRLCYQSSRYQFPPLAKDGSVVPLPLRSSDPLFSEPELHYQPFNVTFGCKRMQLSAVWFGRSVFAVIRIGGLWPAAAGSLAFSSQAGRCHSC